MTDTEMRLEAGSVVALRFHDLGRVVDVDTLASRATGEVERPQFPDGAKGGLRYGRAPVEIALDDVEIPLEDGRVFADASLRVFDFGIAVLALRVLVGGLDWDRFKKALDEIIEASTIEWPVAFEDEMVEQALKTAEINRLNLRITDEAVNSAFDRFAISRVGAQGLMQVMPAWAGYWRNCGRDLYDIQGNLCHGTRILAYYLERAVRREAPGGDGVRQQEPELSGRGGSQRGNPRLYPDDSDGFLPAPVPPEQELADRLLQRGPAADLSRLPYVQLWRPGSGETQRRGETVP